MARPLAANPARAELIMEKVGFPATPKATFSMIKRAGRRRSVRRPLDRETGLRGVVRQRSAEERFTLEDASVEGHGLRPEFRGAGWEQIRDTIYTQP
ncbi:hypothetical protein E1262_11940 [Jiangella aurantiaca]|uniref:Uncharacterized protein n=1 Tax=Jiangella aurantiaca TaxID=2530373 RepID=A0A4R5AER9_9ACTN|nr:hypothetical protein [Jiangella aurantiaca]TDD69659.1 hypothetical protein E1262_11940 [Jiangella aurantiaca]